MKKQIAKETKTGKLEITISAESGSSPSFSITADFFENRPEGNKSPRRWTSGGCLHEQIFEACPELKPFVDLHLSDLDGVPMHAEENGWYWLAKAAGIPQQWEPEQSELDCFALFMSHARMTGPEAHELVKKVKLAKNPREVWGKALDGLRPRWKSEADAAVSFLESL